MADGTPQVGIDPNFEQRVRDLRTANARDSGPQDLQQGSWQKSQWMVPASWGGDIFDLDGYTAPFARTQANQQYVASLNGQSPGVVGDTVAGSTQIDYLACLERAFRIRHTMRRPRAFAHAQGRRVGHGAETGVYTKSLDYVRGIVKQAALTPGNTVCPPTS